MLTTKLTRTCMDFGKEAAIHTAICVKVGMRTIPYQTVIPSLLLAKSGVLACAYEHDGDSACRIWLLVSAGSERAACTDIEHSLQEELAKEKAEEPAIYSCVPLDLERVPVSILARLHLSMVTTLDLPDGELAYNAGGRIYHRNPYMSRDKGDEVWTNIFWISNELVLRYGLQTFTRYKVLEEEAKHAKDSEKAKEKLDDMLGGAHVFTKNGQLRPALRRDNIPNAKLYIPMKSEKRKDSKNTAEYIRADLDGPYPDRARVLCRVLESLNEAVDGYAHYEFTDFQELPYSVPKTRTATSLLKGRNLCIESYGEDSDLSHAIARYAETTLGMKVVHDPAAMTLAVVPARGTNDDADDLYYTHEGSSRTALQHFVDDDRAKDGLKRLSAGYSKYLDRLDMWNECHGDEYECEDLEDGRFIGKRTGKSLRFPVSKPTFATRWIEADKAISELLVKSDIGAGCMRAFDWKGLGLPSACHISYYVRNDKDADGKDTIPHIVSLEIEPDGIMHFWAGSEADCSGYSFMNLESDRRRLLRECPFAEGDVRTPGSLAIDFGTDAPVVLAKTEMRVLPAKGFIERKIFWNGRKTADEARRVLGDAAGVHFAACPDMEDSGCHAVLFSIGKSAVGRKDMNEPRASAVYAALSEEEIPYGLVAALVCQKIVKTKDYSQPIIKKYLDEYVRYRDRIARVTAADARQTA